MEYSSLILTSTAIFPLLSKENLVGAYRLVTYSLDVLDEFSKIVSLSRPYFNVVLSLCS